MGLAQGPGMPVPVPLTMSGSWGLSVRLSNLVDIVCHSVSSDSDGWLSL